MKNLRTILMLPAVLLAAACGGEDVPRPDDRDDLAWLDTMSMEPAAFASPVETGLIEEPEPEAAPAQPVVTRSSPRRTAAAQRSAPAPVYSAPARTGRVVTQRNTARDAAIGAGAGAVLGTVVAGRGNRTKGAIIGGAAGAVIGGVIGHTVDKKERVVYD
ncbi:MAG TPA: glycine zipper domain-containing protein [Longimicrobiales bacterium]|nr:glycine zipper domain-containing protein [Longimicrobiales bacterium]